MARFSEDTLNNWRFPPSTSEEDKLANAEKMIRDAIQADKTLAAMRIDVFGQGSYANDTNVRLNSDVDINVSLRDTVFYRLPNGKTKEDFGYTDSSYSFSEFKNSVQQALNNAFGNANVNRGNKCFTIKENTYRGPSDVVASFNYNRHDDDGTTSKGTKFFTDGGEEIINYPLQHIANGKQKNSDTQKRFKRLTRIVKRVRYKMIEDRVALNPNITSFLIECLLWNVPNSVYNDNHTWTDRLKGAIRYIYQQTAQDSSVNEWGEVSELLYLFRVRKWSRSDVHEFMQQLWDYLEY